MAEADLPEYAEYANDDSRALYNFLADLPRSANEVAPDDMDWLVHELRDPLVANELSTKFVASVADKMGTSVIMKPSIFLMKLTTVLAIYWELDYLLTDEVPDAHQASWLKTLQSINEMPSQPEEEPFRSLVSHDVQPISTCPGGRLP